MPEEKKERLTYIAPSVELFTMTSPLNLLRSSSITIEMEVEEGDEDTFLPLN